MKDAGAPKGTYSSRDVGRSYLHLEPGVRYRVRQAFRDFDREEHAVGETWWFIGSAFLPYDDGRSLFVSFDGEREWHIRVQDREEEQRAILDKLWEYVETYPG